MGGPQPHALHPASPSLVPATQPLSCQPHHLQPAPAPQRRLQGPAPPTIHTARGYPARPLPVQLPLPSLCRAVPSLYRRKHHVQRWWRRRGRERVGSWGEAQRLWKRHGRPHGHCGSGCSGRCCLHRHGGPLGLGLGQGRRWRQRRRLGRSGRAWAIRCAAAVVPLAKWARLERLVQLMVVVSASLAAALAAWLAVYPVRWSSNAAAKVRQGLIPSVQLMMWAGSPGGRRPPRTTRKPYCSALDGNCSNCGGNGRNSSCGSSSSKGRSGARERGVGVASGGAPQATNTQLSSWGCPHPPLTATPTSASRGSALRGTMQHPVAPHPAAAAGETPQTMRSLPTDFARLARGGAVCHVPQLQTPKLLLLHVAGMVRARERLTMHSANINSS